MRITPGLTTTRPIFNLPTYSNAVYGYHQQTLPMTQQQQQQNGQQLPPNPFAHLQQQPRRQMTPAEHQAWWRSLSPDERAQRLRLEAQMRQLQQVGQPPQAPQHIPIDPSILSMGVNGQQQHQNGARRPSVGVPGQYTQNTLTSSGAMPATPPRSTASPSRPHQIMSPNGQRHIATVRAPAGSPPRTGSHMSSLARPAGHVQSPQGQQCQGRSPSKPSAQQQLEWAESNDCSRQPVYQTAVQHQNPPHAQGQGQQRAPISPLKAFSQYQHQPVQHIGATQHQAVSQSRNARSAPNQPPYSQQQGQKRQATDQPDGPVHPGKRQATMMPPSSPSTLGHQQAYPPQQQPANGGRNVAQELLHRNQQQQNQAQYRSGSPTNSPRIPPSPHNSVMAAHNSAAAARINQEARDAAAHRQRQAENYAEQQRAHAAHLAEYQRVHAAQLAAQAASLQREKDAARKEELWHDPSALYRHYLEYIKFFPPGPGEEPNPYHMRLLANRPVYESGDPEYNDAIRLAKENWDCYAEWPKDRQKYVDAAKARKA